MCNRWPRTTLWCCVVCVLTVLARSLLYTNYGGDCLDSHHGFIVQYKMGEDLNLGFHYDESEVTLNVCLGRSFVGGSLYFRGRLMEPETHGEYFEYQHIPGRAALHLGKHRHGALSILSGERCACEQ